MKVQLADNTVISQENILDLGKAIALKAVKVSLRYAYGNLNYFYEDAQRAVRGYKYERQAMMQIEKVISRM